MSTDYTTPATTGKPREATAAGVFQCPYEALHAHECADGSDGKATQSPRQQGAPLGNTANNYGTVASPQVSALSDEQEAMAMEALVEAAAIEVAEAERRVKQHRAQMRTEMGKLQKYLWQVSSLKRVRYCRKHAFAPLDGVTIRQDEEGTVGFAGLVTCGSVWACPMCNQKIMHERREEVKHVISTALNAGATVLFTTMTLRHRVGQPLDELWTAIGKGFSAVNQARKVRRLQDEHDYVGYVRLLEVTNGQNGWHPHLHVLEVYAGELSDADIAELRDAQLSVWKRQAVKRGLGEPNERGVVIERVRSSADVGETVAKYMSKATYESTAVSSLDGRQAESVAWEMASPATKRGRLKTSRTPFQILKDAQETGNADDMDLWWEYEAASKGKRMLTWSQKLREFVKLNEERSDEDIAAEEIGTKDNDVIGIPSWGEVMYADAQRVEHVPSEILNVLELEGVEACLAYLKSIGVRAIDMRDMGDV